MSDDEVEAVEPARDDDSTPLANDRDRDGETFDPPIEPGSPSAESVVFVLLGVAVALAVLVRLIQLFG